MKLRYLVFLPVSLSLALLFTGCTMGEYEDEAETASTPITGSGIVLTLENVVLRCVQESFSTSMTDVKCALNAIQHDGSEATPDALQAGMTVEFSEKDVSNTTSLGCETHQRNGFNQRINCRYDSSNHSNIASTRITAELHVGDNEKNISETVVINFVIGKTFGRSSNLPQTFEWDSDQQRYNSRYTNIPIKETSFQPFNGVCNFKDKSGNTSTLLSTRNYIHKLSNTGEGFQSTHFAGSSNIFMTMPPGRSKHRHIIRFSWRTDIACSQQNSRLYVLDEIRGRLLRLDSTFSDAPESFFYIAGHPKHPNYRGTKPQFQPNLENPRKLTVSFGETVEEDIAYFVDGPIGKPKRLWKFKNDSLTLIDSDFSSWTNEGELNFLKVQSDSLLFSSATSKGVWRYDLTAKKATVFMDTSGRGEWSNVTSFATTTDSNLFYYASKNNSLFAYHKNTNQHIEAESNFGLRLEEVGFPSSSGQISHIHRSGTKWMIGHSGGPFFLWNPNTNAITHLMGVHSEKLATTGSAKDLQFAGVSELTSHEDGKLYFVNQATQLIQSLDLQSQEVAPFANLPIRVPSAWHLKPLELRKRNRSSFVSCGDSFYLGIYNRLWKYDAYGNANEIQVTYERDSGVAGKFLTHILDFSCGKAGELFVLDRKRIWKLSGSELQAIPISEKYTQDIVDIAVSKDGTQLYASAFSRPQIWQFDLGQISTPEPIVIAGDGELAYLRGQEYGFSNSLSIPRPADIKVTKDGAVYFKATYSREAEPIWSSHIFALLPDDFGRHTLQKYFGGNDSNSCIPSVTHAPGAQAKISSTSLCNGVIQGLLLSESNNEAGGQESLSLFISQTPDFNTSDQIIELVLQRNTQSD